MSDGAARPPLQQAPPLWVYPERADPDFRWRERVERTASACASFLYRLLGRDAASVLLRRIEARSAVFERMSVAESVARLAAIRADLRLKGLQHGSIAEALALLRVIAHRRLGLRAFDCQLCAAAALLGGRVAELGSGEGKSLAIALAAATAGLAGIPVHVVTLNDRLARRDAESMAKLYSALSLSSGLVENGCSTDQRRAAYACDVVYVSSREVAFDYLRDRAAMRSRPRDIRMKLRRLAGDPAERMPTVLRGLHFAILDDADSVLIDAARTPLILSRGAASATDAASSEVSEANGQVLARVTYQRLFRRYQRLAGAAAGAATAAAEFAAVYDLSVVRVAAAHPDNRVCLPLQLHRTAEEKHAAIVRRTAELVAQGRPVLIGVRTADCTRALSACLNAAGIEHCSADPLNDAESVRMLARSGQPASVTVVGQTAGQGVDIVLTEAAAERGGLHVIVGEASETLRADLRLAGLCARRGAPGSFEAIVALEDLQTADIDDTFWYRLAQRSERARTHAGAFVMRRLQRNLERMHARARSKLVQAERARDRTLAIAGGAQ